MRRTEVFEMNWFDFVILAILAVGAFHGLKSGLIGASLTAVGVVLGVFLAGQLSDDVGALLTDSISNDTLVTVTSYAIIFVAVMVGAWIVKRILRTVISILFLGWVDKLGGLALGVLAGAAISGALITGMARLTYNFEIPPGGLPQEIVGNVLPLAEAKGWLEDTLTGSALVPTFINLTEAIPADALGFVPADFRVALEILEAQIEGD
jgi:membrane protein required for colicin V production